MDARYIASGIAMLVSGLVSWGIMAVGWFVLGSTIGGFVTMLGCGLLTMGVCPLPIGVVCGLVGVLPLVLGLLEIIAGILVLAQQEKVRGLALVVGVLEVLSVLYGGVGSVIAGIVVLVALRRPADAVEILD